jgi:hypothetical protein
VPLKGTYPTSPIIYSSNKAFDKVWGNVIDLFAQSNIPINIIDKSSGLIISKETRLRWAIEGKDGTLSTKNAEVVLRREINRGNRKLIKPDFVTGTWNIHVKEENGETLINVNLHELKGHKGEYFAATARSKAYTYNLGGQTTGVFEQRIYDIIK